MKPATYSSDVPHEEGQDDPAQRKSLFDLHKQLYTPSTSSAAHSSPCEDTAIHSRAAAVFFNSNPEDL